MYKDCNQLCNDIDVMTCKLNNTYSYKIPLCVQTVPKTENQSQWGGDNIFYKFGVKMLILLFSYFKFEEKKTFSRNGKI